MLQLIHCNAVDATSQQQPIADESSDPAVEPTNQNMPSTETTDLNLQGKRPELIQQVKKNLLTALGFRAEPQVSPTTSRQVFLPIEIVKEYVKRRTEMLNNIPDDKDFMGKIPLKYLDEENENLWNSSSYEIAVTLDEEVNRDRKNFVYTGTASDITSLQPVEDPIEMPPQLELTLPPHARSNRFNKPFFSVHLKFNASQEMLIRPPGPEDVRAATLKIDRVAINCDTSSSEPCDDASDSFSLATNKDKMKLMPRYQRVYILQVTGYAPDGHPLASIVDSRRIDTSQSQKLLFDVTALVKPWIADPESNHGIIVRVTYDDDDLKKILEANSTEIIPKLTEHVRLKRDFRSYSESEQTWFDTRPMILLYTEPASRRHVKREQSDTSADSHPHYAHGTVSNVSTTSPGSPGRTRAMPAAARKSRLKTTIQKAKPRSKTTKCKKHTLSVDFNEVGWTSWIIAPLVYDANYCLGECSYPLHDGQEATNHAILQSIFHSSGRLVEKVKCAPTSYGKITIIYQMDGRVMMTSYEEMSVESCGCR